MTLRYALSAIMAVLLAFGLVWSLKVLCAALYGAHRAGRNRVRRAEDARARDLLASQRNHPSSQKWN